MRILENPFLFKEVKTTCPLSFYLAHVFDAVFFILQTVKISVFFVFTFLKKNYILTHIFLISMFCSFYSVL